MGATLCSSRSRNLRRALHPARAPRRSRHRLLTDIILNARERLVTVNPSGAIDIATVDASSPPASSARVTPHDGSAFSRRLESGTFDGGWVQLEDAWFLGRSRRNSDNSVFRA